ncbi:MAG TPA: hypothetical protein VK205_10790 [Prolixibacteraceae bacterium]|nr:hypothetical protein [Prolixibacteraceae bacterium]
MSIKTFWTILLKVIGIWMFLSGFTAVTYFFSSVGLISYAENLNIPDVIYYIGALLLILGLFLLIIKMLIFNPNWIINKLKLVKGIEEETLDLNVGSNAVINIAIIVTGAVLIIDALPLLCQSIFIYLQQKTIFRNDPGAGSIILLLAKSVLGYFLLTKSKIISEFIAKKKVDKPEPVE